MMGMLSIKGLFVSCAFFNELLQRINRGDLSVMHFLNAQFNV